MAATHLLDTSVYSQPLRRAPLGSVIRRWKLIGEERLAVSAICEAELLEGLELKNSPRLWALYGSLLQHRLPVLPVDSEVAAEYARIASGMSRRGQTRSEFDLLIAATARSRGLVLATCNAKHFSGIEGLAVEDWNA